MDDDFEYTQQCDATQSSVNLQTVDNIEDAAGDASLHMKTSGVWGILRRKGGDGSNYPDIKLYHRINEDGKRDLYTVGRNKNCDVVIKDTHVSSNHCVIYCDYSSTFLRIMITDTSSNGTFINDAYTKLTKGQSLELRGGDEIFLKQPLNSSAVNAETDFIFINMRDRLFDNREISASSMMSQLSRQGSSLPNPKEPHIEDFYAINTQQLGSGNCGQVHVCVKKDTNEHFAVKIIDTKKFSITGLSIDDLRSEAKMMKALDHPYIIKVKDTFETDKIIFIVMELLRGGDLFDRIIEKGKYTEESARKVMLKILLAVEYLHNNDIIHRDLKPENILLVDSTDDENIKLTDFGLAKKMNQEGLKTFCGTPQYFAPEVLKRKGTVNGRGRYNSSADVWSIGVILYILLSGAFPFEEERVNEQIMNASYSFTGPEWVGVSDGAKHLIRCLLTLRPENRITVSAALKHPWITGINPSAAPVNISLPLSSSSFKNIPKPPAQNSSVQYKANQNSKKEIPITIAFSKQENNKQLQLNPQNMSSALMPPIPPPSSSSSSSSSKSVSDNLSVNEKNFNNRPAMDVYFNSPVKSSNIYNNNGYGMPSPADGSFMCPSSQTSNRSCGNSQDSESRKVYWSNRIILPGQKKSNVIEELISKSDTYIGLPPSGGNRNSNHSQNYESEREDFLRSPLFNTNNSATKKSDIFEKPLPNNKSGGSIFDSSTSNQTSKSKRLSASPNKAAADNSNSNSNSNKSAPHNIDSFFSKVMQSQPEYSSKTSSQKDTQSSASLSQSAAAVSNKAEKATIPSKRGLSEVKKNGSVGIERSKSITKKSEVKHIPGKVLLDQNNKNRFLSSELDGDEIIEISSDSDNEDCENQNQAKVAKTENNNNSSNNSSSGSNSTVKVVNPMGNSITNHLNKSAGKSMSLRSHFNQAQLTSNSDVATSSAATTTSTSASSVDKDVVLTSSSTSAKAELQGIFNDAALNSGTKASASNTNKRKQKSPTKFNNFARKPVSSMHVALKK